MDLLATVPSELACQTGQCVPLGGCEYCQTNSTVRVLREITVFITILITRLQSRAKADTRTGDAQERDAGLESG